MQLTPGLGVCPFKNNSLQVKNTVGGFPGVTDPCDDFVSIGAVVEVINIGASTEDEGTVVIFNSSVVVGSILKRRKSYRRKILKK